ncbi:MAG TPA: allantoinase AllB [Kofleriaceae bacterium]|nr:allantoinase AllB [Kofleriaceae bacterium]
MSADLVVRSRRVVTGGAVRPAAIHIEAGVIADVSGWDELPPGAPLRDAGDLLVSPGLVDSHVHVNEPGRTEWEGFASATRAAAAGGVTTIVDMPLNSIPPTTSVAALEAKRAAAAGQCWVDVGFHGGVVPGNLAELEPLCRAGVLGFKCFLLPSGVDEFGHVGEAELAPALDRLAAAGVALSCHAELEGPIARAADALLGESPYRYLTYLRSRPPGAEDQAIALMIALARSRRARVHVVHCSSAGALELLAAARQEGVPIGAETCPHYLHFAAEDVPDRATEYKCAPPIREAENRERLWQGLQAGVLDMIVSDHSPCTPALKLRGPTPDIGGDFLAAWGGIASLQLALPSAWTEMRRRGLPAAQLAEWMSAAPARHAGLGQRKGAIERGRDADLLVWDPDAGFEVDGARLHHRHALTPYDGETLFGVVHTTIVGGQIAYGDGQHAARPPGRFLLRT